MDYKSEAVKRCNQIIIEELDALDQWWEERSVARHKRRMKGAVDFITTGQKRLDEMRDSIIYGLTREGIERVRGPGGPQDEDNHPWDTLGVCQQDMKK